MMPLALMTMTNPAPSNTRALTISTQSMRQHTAWRGVSSMRAVAVLIRPSP